MIWPVTTWRAALLASAACALTGCATATVQRDAAIDLVSRGDRAVEASRSYYASLATQRQQLIRALYVANPGCPLGDTLLLRRSVSEETLAAIPTGHAACRDAFRRDNGQQSICASDDARRCRTAIAEDAPQLADALGREWQLGDSGGPQVSTALDLIRVINRYIDALGRIAARDESPQTSAARLDELLLRVNVVYCRIEAASTNAPDDNCQPKANGSLPEGVARLKLDADVGAAVQATSNLFEFVGALRDDLRAAREIGATLEARGPDFEADLQRLIVDVENKRKAWLSFYSAELLEMIRDEWRQRAVMLDATERGVVVDRYQAARDALAATLTQPADAARLLERLREAHRELRALHRGETTPAQRARIEKLTRQRLADGFELAVRTGATWSQP